MKSVATAALLLIFAIAAAPPARASEASQKTKAARLIEEGNGLFDQKKYQEALERYQSAYEAYPSPKIYYSLATVCEELGRSVEALEYYEKFLEEAKLGPKNRLHQAAIKAKKNLEGRVGTLVFTGPKGTEIFLGTKPLGVLEMKPVRVEPGFRLINARLPNGATWTGQIEIAAGKRREIAIEAPPPRAPDPVVEPEPEAFTAIAPVQPEREESDDSSVLGEWWFWALVAGGIGAGTGVILATRSSADPARDYDLGVTSFNDWSPP